MASDKDDDSTGIEKAVKKFAEDINKSVVDILKDQADKHAKAAAGKKPAPKAEKPLTIVFSFDPNPATRSRTPAEQAQQVIEGRSWVCWGAHMADKARHVIMRVNGKVSWDAKKAFGDAFSDFKSEWASKMKSNGLKNAKGQDGWFPGDAFHLELDDSKIAKTDERTKACIKEYVRLTREAGKSKNDKFEKSYESLLKPYLKPYEEKAATAKQAG